MDAPEDAEEAPAELAVACEDDATHDDEPPDADAEDDVIMVDNVPEVPAAEEDVAWAEDALKADDASEDAATTEEDITAEAADAAPDVEEAPPDVAVEAGTHDDEEACDEDASEEEASNDDDTAAGRDDGVDVPAGTEHVPSTQARPGRQSSGRVQRKLPAGWQPAHACTDSHSRMPARARRGT